MKRLLHEPLLHFLLIGAGLFLLFGWRSSPASLPAGPSGSPSTKIVVAQDDIDRMVAVFTRTWTRPPTNEETRGLIDDFVRDEIFYREAVAAGLDRDDGVIRRRLRQKMEFILEDITAQTEPTDEELLAYMKKHPDSFLVDPQVAFRHVYVNVDKRGMNAEADARQILAKLDEGSDPDTLGDPILLDAEIELSRFGISKTVRRRVQQKSPWPKSGNNGRGRSARDTGFIGPCRRARGRPPAGTEGMREMVKRDLMAERQKELKDAAYAKIRERYTVVVEKTNADKKTASMVLGGGAKQ